MKGISYLVDDAGEKTAVILDLRKYRQIWEDIHDRILIESRRGELRTGIEQVRKSFARRTAKSHG